MFVQPGLNSDIGSSHSLLGELADLLDGSGSALLKPDTVNPLVDIDGVIPGHHLIDGRFSGLFTLFLRHLKSSRTTN